MNKFVTSYLSGGLGNVLFQVTAALSYSIDNNIPAVFNINQHLLPNQGNDIKNYKENLLRNIKFVSKIDDYDFIYDEAEYEYNEIPKKDSIVLRGGFSSCKYFEHNRSKILDIYDIDSVTDQHIKENYIIDFNQTISLHIRRGDYIKFPDHHPILPKKYYNDALTYIFSNDTTIKNVLVFSDDIKWCKSNFSDEFIFIDEKDYISLYMMSMCKHNIIANSTFSWWGAWLNKNDSKIIITPDKWFGEKYKHFNTKDLIKDEWIKIEWTTTD